MERGRGWTRWRRGPWAEDLALGGALGFLLIFTDLIVDVVDPQMVGPGSFVVLGWGVLAVLPLVLRRRFPIAVFVAVLTQVPLFWATEWHYQPPVWLLLGVVAYSAAVWGRPRWVALALTGALLEVLVLMAVDVAPEMTGGQPRSTLIFLWFTVWVNYSLPVLVGVPTGLLVRRIRLYRDTLEERNAQLAVEREDRARRAVLEERVRIARELHDVLAHHVSVMGVQAGAARRLLDRRPEAALESIVEVEVAARQAMTDLSQLLGVLRAVDPEPTSTSSAEPGDDRSPQPGLGELSELAERMRRAGLVVDFDLDDLPEELPGAVQLSAFRIVQEALTNTLRHAGGARAHVRVSRRTEGIEIIVRDSGMGGRQPEPMTSTRPEGQGRGLLGMRERVALHGGEFEAGPLVAGGYQVRAVLPVVVERVPAGPGAGS